jgi:hypothetical protein
MARPQRNPVPFHVPFFFAGAVEARRRAPEATVGRMVRNALGDDLSAARYMLAVWKEEWYQRTQNRKTRARKTNVIAATRDVL